MTCCYIIRRNAITTSDIKTFTRFQSDFHDLRQVFIEEGVRESVSLPRQHALVHYPRSIKLFGSPNGTCTSQTEAKHKIAVKETWRRSNRNEPLPQMTTAITRADKLESLGHVFKQRGMLEGDIGHCMTQLFLGNQPSILPWRGGRSADTIDVVGNDDNVEPVLGPRTSNVRRLPHRHGKFFK